MNAQSPAAGWQFGAVPLPGGGVRFRLWAPTAGPGLRLEVEGLAPIPLEPDHEGWAETVVPGIGPGVRYRYRLADGLAFPDPASRLQHADADGDSVVIAPDHYAWRHASWQGLPWEDAVIYEAHAGLAGGFDGLRERLPDLAALGITVLELMPVGDFAGARNWGYDGVLPFAPDTSYGTPDALKALVDAAHGLGMGVMLDVVYNHFGPSGNYLPRYAGSFFRQDIDTPWGAAIDFRQPAVRAFFEENALHWLTEYRIDGLRLDAVHAIAAPDWLRELPGRLRARLPAGRRVHLVVEDDMNRAELLEHGYDAQWNDDIHHVLHHLLTGETQGYYADYSGDGEPAGLLARCLAQGWVYQGQPSPYRGGEPRGQPSAHLPPTAFVVFLQNHDQTGNRAFGERLTRLSPRAPLRKAAIALQLLVPQIPLIFMGEEHGSRRPFHYFTGFADPQLARAVREGRRREFSRFEAFRDETADLPDPNAESTFERSRPWVGAGTADSQRWAAYYRRLLSLRRERLSPRLKGARALEAAALGPAGVCADWSLGDGAGLRLYANLSGQAVGLPHAHALPEDWQPLFETPLGAFRRIEQGELPADCAVWLLREP